MTTEKIKTANIEITKRQRKLLVSCLNELMPNVLEKAQEMDMRECDEDAERLAGILYDRYAEMRELKEILLFL